MVYQKKIKYDFFDPVAKPNKEEGIVEFETLENLALRMQSFSNNLQNLFDRIGYLLYLSCTSFFILF